MCGFREELRSRTLRTKETVGSHNCAVFIFALFAFFLTLPELAFLIAGWRMRLTRCSSPDNSKTLLCSFVSVVGSLNVPDVRFERITSATDTHLCEVAAGVFSFGKTCVG